MVFLQTILATPVTDATGPGMKKELIIIFEILRLKRINKEEVTAEDLKEVDDEKKERARQEEEARLEAERLAQEKEEQERKEREEKEKDHLNMAFLYANFSAKCFYYLSLTNWKYNDNICALAFARAQFYVLFCSQYGKFSEYL